MKRDLSKPLASSYGDPKPKAAPKKLKKIKAEPLISPTQHAKNTPGYYHELSHYKGRKLHAVPSRMKKPKSWSASGGLTSKSGMRDKKFQKTASTVDKRFSNAKDTKKLKKK